MIEMGLEIAAQRLWRGVGGKAPPFPRNLEEAALVSLRLDIIEEHGLHVRMVEDWIAQRGGAFRFLCHERALHGCVVALRGQGAIFLDADDSINTKRFTLAHEIAHFLQDYLLPRE